MCIRFFVTFAVFRAYKSTQANFSCSHTSSQNLTHLYLLAQDFETENISPPFKSHHHEHQSAIPQITGTQPPSLAGRHPCNSGPSLWRPIGTTCSSHLCGGMCPLSDTHHYHGFSTGIWHRLALVRLPTPRGKRFLEWDVSGQCDHILVLGISILLISEFQKSVIFL